MLPVSGTLFPLENPAIAPESFEEAPPEIAPTVSEMALSASVVGLVTHYGVSYHGQPMGCDGTPYDTNNETIIAVGPEHYFEWPCGQTLVVCGLAGCIVGARQDACPGCGPGHLDLSEAGIDRVCGYGAGYCRVTIQTPVEQ